MHGIFFSPWRQALPGAERALGFFYFNKKYTNFYVFFVPAHFLQNENHYRKRYSLLIVYAMIFIHTTFFNCWLMCCFLTIPLIHIFLCYNVNRSRRQLTFVHNGGIIMEITIGINIKRLRTARNITQEQLSAAMNVTCAAVSKWERGGSLR